MTTTSAAAAAAAIQEADPDYWETLDLVVVTEKQIRANKKKNDLLDNLQKSQLLHILNGDYYWGDAKTLEDCSNDRIVDDASMIYKELLVVNNNSKLTTTVESAEETASPRRFYYWQAYFGGNPTGYLLTSSKATTTITTTTTTIWKSSRHLSRPVYVYVYHPNWCLLLKNSSPNCITLEWSSLASSPAL
mmetsp:Transcript_11303/g.18710  ORF Transcript_11303/g.18710 Transcript_11303/m.18710 type:complete len:190 (-) Transcript_11303:2183-2752(-)